MGRFKGGCVSATDKGRVGVFRLDEVADEIRSGAWLRIGGQAEWLTPGTYTWTCPAGVTEVSAVCVGAGGGGYSSWASNAGGGGGLGWKNSIPVIPGKTYNVFVGARGQTNGNGNGWTGGNSYFINLSTVAGYGGGNGTAGAYTGGPNANGSGGGWVGDGGGAGGTASYQGGGGAGGYSGNGGGSSANAPAGGGGAGGGYYSSTYGTGAGGGVGIYGIRTDYTAETNRMYGVNAYSGTGQGASSRYSSASSGLGGEGGSSRTGTSNILTGRGGMQGENAIGASYYGASNGGGFPGGGGGGPGTSSGGGNGADGAVRIIWRSEVVERAFPATNTEDI